MSRIGWRVLVAFAIVAALASNLVVGQTRPIDPGIQATSPANAANQGPQTLDSQSQDAPSRGLQAEAAQQPVAKAGNDLAAAIQTRQDQLGAETERSAEVKESLQKMYQQALADLTSADQASLRKKDWSDRAVSAPGRLESLKKAKEGNSSDGSAVNTPNFQSLGYDEAQLKLQGLEAELANAISERTKLQEDAAKRATRQKELPQLISDAKSKIEQLTSLPPPQNSTDDPLIAEAMNWSTEASKLALQTQLEALESEQRAFESEAMLAPLQLESAQAREKKLQEQVRELTADLSERRKNRITGYAIEFRKYANLDLPVLNRIRGWLAIDEVKTDKAEFDITWPELAVKQAEIKAEMELAQAEFDRWKEMRAEMNGRVGSDSVSGFNSWVGLRLRRQRSELPDASQLSARLQFYQSELQLTDALQAELKDVMPKLRNADDVATDNGEESEAAALSIGEELVSEMRIDAGKYMASLYQIADIKEQMRKLSYEYRDFIDKHILWIRSADRLDRKDIRPAIDAYGWFVSYANWRDLGSVIGRDVQARAVWYLVFFVGMSVLLYNQASMKRRLGEFSSKAEKNTCTAFSLTVRGLVITVLISVPVTLLLLFFAWRITAAGQRELLPREQSEFLDSLAHGCFVAVSVLFPMEWLRQILRVNGLGIKHFGWQPLIAQNIRKHLRWFINLGIPLTLIIGVFAEQGNPQWDSSLGRFAFILLMPLVSLFVSGVFKPGSGVLTNFIVKQKGGWLDRLSFVWYPLAILAPLGLAIVSFIGYHYTAQRIAIHLDSTLWLLVVMTVFYCFFKRWLVLNRRKLMIAQAKQRLEDAAKRDPNASLPVRSDNDGKVDLISINEQSKRLLSSFIITVGLAVSFLIWSDVLPAISLLDGFPLWTVKGDVPEDTVVISLANLVLVVPIVVLVVIAARNVPGLLEIALLQNLPLTNAARYAITTLARYAIVGLGIVLAASTIGLRWTSIQWLVAALGVGLGFGLQEIFANFVSGIILLFEQPIRVGDIITVDGTTGSVSKIRMRATTIVNWDRQELIVPNKELITGKLLNWTLTDTTNRVVLNVGVAYGSDVSKACQLISEICEEHRDILDEPAPIVTFEGFGDNTLNLVVRAYLASLDGRLGVVHELHQKVYLALNAAGIEIAFPQRDLHIRSLPDSIVNWLGAKQ